MHKIAFFCFISMIILLDKFDHFNFVYGKKIQLAHVNNNIANIVFFY